MKKSYPKMTLIMMLLSVLAFTSCVKEEEKKTEVDITQNNIKLVIAQSESHLSLINNRVFLAGELVPSHPENKLTVHVWSKADPDGFSFETTLKDDSREEGDHKYLFKLLSTSVYAGPVTDAAKRVIAVNKGEDNIEIKVEGLFSGDVAVKTGSYNIGYSLGRMKYNQSNIYSFDGTEVSREAILVATTRVPNPLLIKLTYQATDMGFPSFSAEFNVVDRDDSLVTTYQGENELEYFVGAHISDGSVNDSFTLYHKGVKYELENDSGIIHIK